MGVAPLSPRRRACYISDSTPVVRISAVAARVGYIRLIVRDCQAGCKLENVYWTQIVSVEHQCEGYYKNGIRVFSDRLDTYINYEAVSEVATIF